MNPESSPHPSLRANSRLARDLGVFRNVAAYHLRNLASIPAVTRDGFVFVSGSKSVEEARQFFGCINLEGMAAKIRCPLLVVHGGLDTITPMENATRMIAEAGGPVETLIWEDSGHCCHDRAHIVRPGADFLARHLRGGKSKE